MKQGRRKPIENATAIVAEVKMPGLAEAIFDAFVHSDHYRGLRLVATRQQITVGEAERVVQAGVREMIANGAKAPRFRNGFGKPVGREVVSMPARLKGVAA